MTREDFIESIISNIDDKLAKIEVKNELEAHLDDRIAFYTDAGYNYDYALEKAIERMGDAEELSEKLSGIHNTEKYRKLAYLFTVLYGLGVIFGAVLTIVFMTNTLDFSEYSKICCMASAIVFLYASLGFFLAQKSHEDGCLVLFSGVSFLNLIAAPLTFIPAGFSLLSFFFQFPYSIFENGSFDYFYYPFDETVLDFFSISDKLSEAFYIILWVIMCAFGLLPIVSGIISFLSYLKNNESNKAFFEKARRYGKILLIISLACDVAITTEIAVETFVIINNNAKDEIRYDIEFQEGWDKFNSLTLPLSLEEGRTLANENSIHDENDSDIKKYGMLTVFEDHWSCIILDYESLNPDERDNFPGFFNSATYLNYPDSDLNEKDIEMLRCIKIGTTEDELWQLISPKELERVIVTADDSSGETVLTKEFLFSYGKDYDSITLVFENGKLKQIFEDGEELE